MQQRLIESIGARTRLLASISHDLRSPLTRLRLRTELLPDEAARERLRDDLDEMEAMVAATLDFAQSVEITEARRDIDMDSLLQGLASDAQEAGAHVDIRGRALKPLAGYPRNLKRCLQNLLDNAVRYGDGTVTITVTDHTHALQIVVGDNGPGLDHTLLERVFEPYFRSRATAGVSPGTGLGLTIARSIAHAHGGTLTLHTGACADDASDRACSGLHAVLTLPRARPTPHALHVAQ
ncbi:hypothetical protein DFQ30_000742 [Apophysomyces sp. BC1015]|nr:hypothetical protein DFQ30_000742 [Apophysomyces sp. BC1015]